MVERIAKIIKSLKDFSKDSFIDKLEEVDLAEMLEESLVLYSEKLKEAKVDLKIQISDAPLVCLLQRNQIMQVLIHLFSNAFDDCISVNKPVITISLYRDQEFACLSFSDNGPGVLPEIAEKIMEPFFSTKELGTGTGMGLSVSLGIISAHQGQFTHNPTVSRSCFVIKLPIHQA